MVRVVVAGLLLMLGGCGSYWDRAQSDWDSTHGGVGGGSYGGGSGYVGGSYPRFDPPPSWGGEDVGYMPVEDDVGYPRFDPPPSWYPYRPEHAVTTCSWSGPFLNCAGY
jgi:hypothetical protein